jgi:hypothetical protein
MKKYTFLNNSTHTATVDPDIIEVHFYNTLLHVHSNGNIERVNKHTTRPVQGRSGSQYDRLCIDGHNVYRHQLVAFAFGLLDDVDNLNDMDICHEVSKASGGSDALDNLFLDTHSFNIKSAVLEKKLAHQKPGVQFKINRDTYDSLLTLIV